MKTTYTRLHCGLTVRGLAWVLLGLGSMIGLGACAPETTPEIRETVAVETYMVGDIEVRIDGLSAHDNAYRTDEITFEIEPGEGFEYKYRLEEGETIVYSWVSAGPIRSEMHSEADDQAEGTAEFFEVIESADSANGMFRAPFPGIHGWYWLNPDEEKPVTLTLRSSGFYSYAMEFRGGEKRRYEPATVSTSTESSR
ncbi:MAG: hypothetical protein VYA69_05585 [Gemmatimonadota bacterium]|nr:hypothetical protein [Gemmatimonadota bacterium]